MDGVADEGWCGDGVLARMVYEWENGGRGTGNHVFGMRLSEIWESYELSPRLKFGRLVCWGYDGNLASPKYLPVTTSGEERVFCRPWLAPTVYERA